MSDFCFSSLILFFIFLPFFKVMERQELDIEQQNIEEIQTIEETVEPQGGGTV